MRTTTLYDLMSEINEATCGPEVKDILRDGQEPAGNDRTSRVVEKVAQMFASGQIRFMNSHDFKRKYSEWLL